MNAGFSGRSIFTVFVVVLLCYLGGFYGLEHLRVRRGPWEVSFAPNADGAPAVVVDQPSVGISNVSIKFPGEKLPADNPTGSVRFDRVEKNAVFGEVIYEDLTFLPGVVTFNLFGHEIELMPRVLVINKKEIPWRSGLAVEVWPTNKPAHPPKGPKGNRPVRDTNSSNSTY